MFSLPQTITQTRYNDHLVFEHFLGSNGSKSKNGSPHHGQRRTSTSSTSSHISGDESPPSAGGYSPIRSSSAMSMSSQHQGYSSRPPPPPHQHHLMHPHQQMQQTSQHRSPAAVGNNNNNNPGALMPVEPPVTLVIPDLHHPAGGQGVSQESSRHVHSHITQQHPGGPLPSMAAGFGIPSFHT